MKLGFEVQFRTRWVGLLCTEYEWGDARESE